MASARILHNYFQRKAEAQPAQPVNYYETSPEKLTSDPSATGHEERLDTSRDKFIETLQEKGLTFDDWKLVKGGHRGDTLHLTYSPRTESGIKPDRLLKDVKFLSELVDTDSGYDIHLVPGSDNSIDISFPYKRRIEIGPPYSQVF